MLYVDGVEIQIEADPKLIFMANDFENKGRSHKSFSITIPNTVHNDTALDNLFSKKYQRKIRFDALLDVPPLTLTGYLVINAIDKQKATGLFVSGNGRLWAELEGKSLRDFDWSKFDSTLTLANVLASENGGAMIYDLTDRGKWENVVSEYADRIDITQRYPAIRVKEILQTIFLEQGIGLNINTNIDDIYLLYTQDRNFRNSDKWLKESVFKGTGAQNEVSGGSDQSGSIQITAGLELITDNDPGGNYSEMSKEYIAQETGTYRFAVAVDWTILMADAADNRPAISYNSVDERINSAIIVRKNGGIIHNIGVTSFIANGEGGNGFNIDTYWIELAHGDVITFELRVTFDYNFVSWSSPYQINLDIGSVVTTDCSRYYGAGSVVKWGEVLPEMNALEFIGAALRLLNIDIYYKHEFGQVDLYLYDTEPNPGIRVQVDEYEERTSEDANIIFEFDNDKQGTPGSLTIPVGVATESETMEFDFSRTLISNSFRLFQNFDTLIPVLWSAGDPLMDVFSVAYSVPDHETRANLRLLRYTGKATGLSYSQSYGGETGSSYATATTAPLFDEVDIIGRHNYNYVGDRVEITCRAQLTATQVHALYYQQAFLDSVTLIDKVTGEVLGAGRLLEATQLQSNVYKLRLRRL